MTTSLWLPLFLEGATQLGIHLTGAQLEAFDQYSRLLIDWNQRINLTRIIDPVDIAHKHFLDSLSLVQAIPLDLDSKFSLIDVGSGAGFPGIPLKIVLPDFNLTLLEATNKKTIFLQHVVDQLRLENVTMLTARAEEAGRQPAQRGQYDLAVARAVAPLSVLAEYTLPLVKVGGWVIAQKGQHPAEEIKQAANALGILGGQVKHVVAVTIPGVSAARHLVLIQKIKPTPKFYPRRPGLPTKKPI